MAIVFNIYLSPRGSLLTHAFFSIPFIMFNYWTKSDGEDVVPNEEIVRWE